MARNFMNDWHKISIKDISETITSGGTPSRVNMGHFIGDIPWVKSGEVNGWYIYDTEEHINPEAIRRSSAKLFQRDTVLVAMYGQGETIGKVGILGVPASSNQALCAITTDATKCDPKFLMYLLQVKREEIILLAQGAARRNLNVGKIANFKIDIPDIEIQKRISDIISGYNFLIENNKKRIDILEEMAQRLYTEWFVKFMFPGHENVKMVNSGSEFGEIPEGWEIKRVDETIERHSAGKRYSSKTVLEKGQIPVLDQGKSGIIGYHNGKPGCVASEEDPIIVFANHTCYQRLIFFPFSSIQNVLPFKAVDSKYNIYWLHYATKDAISFNDYKGHWPEFMAKKIMVPDHKIATSFGEKVRPNLLMIKKLGELNLSLSNTRELMIENLITGKRLLKQNVKTN